MLCHMIPAVRHQSIMSALRERGGLSVGELAEVLEVSPSTIRRDLSMMEDEGILRRTFGGAVLSPERDDPIDEVRLANADAKRRIAAAAAGLVEDGMTVILDVGTSALAVAHELLGRSLTIVTASVPVFLLFAEEPAARLLLLGGGYRSDYRCTSGHMTVEALREVRADLSFMGCSGIAGDGMTRDTTLDQVSVKRAIAQSGSANVLLADATKFPGKGSYAVLPLTTMSHIVTDLDELGDLTETLATAGTGVLHV